jgi:hypothetical protein
MKHAFVFSIMHLPSQREKEDQARGGGKRRRPTPRNEWPWVKLFPT